MRADPGKVAFEGTTADGREIWATPSDAQREIILRRREQGDDYTIGFDGQILFHKRQPTHPLFWKRGPDDPNKRAGIEARKRYIALSRRPQASVAPSVSPRRSSRPHRTPAARPAARRPARRNTSARAGPSSDGDDGPGPRPEPSRAGESRHFSSGPAAFLKGGDAGDAPPLIAYVRDPQYGLVNLRLAAVLREAGS